VETRAQERRALLAGLLPHAPIVVPGVAPSAAASCARTTEACRELAEALVTAGPARLVLISPHAPRADVGFGVWSGARLRGDLGSFGLASARVDLPSDPEFAAALERSASTWEIAPGALDHGAVVPLCFLVDAGWGGPTTVVGLPWQPSVAELTEFGRKLGEVARSLPGSSALVASGDLSHRVLPGAPAGYDPKGVQFDRRFVDLLREGRAADVLALSEGLRRAAAEDVIDATCIVLAALGGAIPGARVLSYEHPFGVGYLVAALAGIP
jgi:aromatic ring-opening dioxygenase LigB subunit